MKEHAKKAFKHKVTVLGKTVPTIAIALVLLGGTGTAALLTNFGAITGQATVDQAGIQLDGQDSPTLYWAWDERNQEKDILGNTFVEEHSLVNNAGQTQSVDITTECAIGGDGGTDRAVTSADDTEGPETQGNLDWTNISNSGADNENACNGIHQRFVEYYDDAGASFSDYQTSGTFGVTVDSDFDSNQVDNDDTQFQEIQAAIDNGAGDQILVKEGTYDGFTVSSYHEVVAENPPNGGSSALVEGPIYVEASESLVKGLEVTDTSGGQDSRGIVVTSSAVRVLSNYVHDVDADEHAVGIFAFGKNEGVSGTEIRNNKVEDIYATDLSAKSRSVGITLTGIGGDDDYVEIEGNTVEAVGNSDSDLSAGVEVNGPDTQNFNVSLNEISDIERDSGFDLGVYVTRQGSGNAFGSDAVVTHNNFLSTGSDDFDVGTFELGSTGDLDATENYFGTNGIQVGSKVDGDWETKSVDDLSLNAGEKDRFGVWTEFASNLAPNTYEATSTVSLS